VDSFHRELGKIMWEHCGMARNAEGSSTALAKIPPLREQYWSDVKVLGTGEELNQSLEKAGRVADFFELAELMCRDALERNESAAATSARSIRPRKARPRATTNTSPTPPPGSFQGVGQPPVLHKEPLTFEYVHPSQRSYK
jgi:succinate dehydrogenase / fumarate reductase flavoprotein subunit